uniref:Uncharacterized protein n=1 Tax=Lepeophtheirus salmonis TaxID=72036 RepID=A0A0K2UKJ5_LEPSM
MKNIKEKRDCSCFPEGIHEISNEEYTIYFALSKEDLSSTILYGWKVDNDFSYSIFANSFPLSNIEVSNICPSNILSYLSDVCNISAYLKFKLCVGVGIRQFIYRLRSPVLYLVQT